MAAGQLTTSAGYLLVTVQGFINRTDVLSLGLPVGRQSLQIRVLPAPNGKT